VTIDVLRLPALRDRSLRHLPRIVACATGVAIVIYASIALSSPLVFDLDTALLAAISALALSYLVGSAGQIAVGTAAFQGIGAYAVVICGSAVPFPFPIIIGGIVAAVVGLLVGIPSLRLSGLYLIFSTLALQYIAAYAFDEDDTKTNALAGHFIKNPKIFGYEISSDRTWFLILAVIVLLCALVFRNLMHGRPGRALAAVRTNEAAASVIGINVSRAKLEAFVVSAGFTGIAGGLGAYVLQEVNSAYFSLSLAVSYITMILIGGVGSVWGAICGALVITMLPFGLTNLVNHLSIGGTYLPQHLADLETVLYGVIIICFIFFRPGGLRSLVPGPIRRALSPSGPSTPLLLPGEPRA
jgi:branched-chain amino acid transport system permease protein